ncbi:uncharacterized protein [Typha angustifolia]|uniref:uncharacterized protein n=1 Tax=Typha angustifolia TaxID=59011 RepID=UPI003C2E724A
MSSSTKLVTQSSLTMSSLLFFLLLFLFLSLSISSCKARHLSVHFEDLENSSLPHSSKDEAKVDEIRDSATTEGLNSSDDVGVKEESISGADVLMPSPHGGLPEGNQLEVSSGTRVRSSVGIESNEENLGLKEARAMANLVTMDYARAQRGPSVHNR